MTIKIISVIHESINDGGVYVEREYTTGPRNLMLAIDEIDEISRNNTRGYGNVGHCITYIEVDGVKLHEDDRDDYIYSTDSSNFDQWVHLSAVSRTEWCRRWIADARSGQIGRMRRQVCESMCRYEKNQ
jgi:hypothetical protein